MIDPLYDHFRRKTETDTAAAILTLAAVLQGQQDRMLTVEQAAERMGSSTDAIRTMIHDGKLAHKKIGKGGQYRIPESAILNCA